MLKTRCNLSATKIASSYRDKNRLCKRAFRSFLTAGKPSRRSITAVKRKGKKRKGEKGKGKKSKVEKPKDVGHLIVQKRGDAFLRMHEPKCRKMRF